jgi:glutamate formiminotransferase
MAVLECVINISEGRDLDRVARIAAAGGADVLDVHSDAHHHRSVITVVGEPAARAVAAAALAEIDLRTHEGVHPRLGAVDVVPFVALRGSTAADALAARDRFAAWWAGAHGVPCFLYGPERALPDVRRQAFVELAPDTGPGHPSARSGATAVGQRPVLVAYNVWLRDSDLATARRLAALVRGAGVRALGLAVGERHQVSMNLVEPRTTGPAEAYDRVAQAVRATGARAHLDGAELVGLLPEPVLRAVPAARWAQLDLSAERTIEARVAARALG